MSVLPAADREHVVDTVLPIFIQSLSATDRQFVFFAITSILHHSCKLKSVHVAHRIAAARDPVPAPRHIAVEPAQAVQQYQGGHGSAARAC